MQQLTFATLLESFQIGFVALACLVLGGSLAYLLTLHLRRNEIASLKSEYALLRKKVEACAAAPLRGDLHYADITPAMAELLESIYDEEPDTSDIPETHEDWFRKAKLRLANSMYNMSHVVSVVVRGSDVFELRHLLDAIARDHRHINILQAPMGIRYSYPFPILRIKTDAGKLSLFGEEATDFLEEQLK
jgi:hypothetical protein